MTEKTSVSKLEVRRFELDKKLQVKREVVSTQLLEGKDVSKALAEQVALETELSAVNDALAVAARQAAEQDQNAWRAQAEEARQEVGRLNSRADELAMEIIEQLSAQNSLVGEYLETVKRAEWLKSAYKLSVSTRYISPNSVYVNALLNAVSQVRQALRIARSFSPDKFTERFGKTFEN